MIKSLLNLKYITGVAIFFALSSCSEFETDYTSGASDWPQWRGANSNNTATTTGVFAEGFALKVRWKKQLGPGYSSISVVNGHAVTMFSDSTYDVVISFNAETGIENWRYTIDSTWQAPNPSNWGPLSTPLISEGKVFGLGAKGQLFALELASGKKVWKKNVIAEYSTVKPYFGITTSPLVDGDLLIVGATGKNGTISGFDKNSGRLLWSAGSDTVRYHSPMIFELDGKKHLICAGNNYIYGLDPQTGQQYWEFNHNGGGHTTNPVSMGSNRLFFKPGRNEAVAIEINKDGAGYKVNELWKTKETTRTFNTPIYYKGNLYGYTAKFTISLNAETGEENWKSRTPGDGYMMLVDEHLVIVTKEGAVHVAKATPESYQEITSLDVLGKLTWTPPSFANGKIYVRSMYEIAAVDVVAMD